MWKCFASSSLASLTASLVPSTFAMRWLSASAVMS